MPVTGGTTTHGIPKFADGDSPDLAAGGLGTILDTLDGLLGIYKYVPDVTLAAPQSSIDFQNIPQTFAHLLFVADFSCVGASASALLQFNAAGVYDSQRLHGSAATPGTAQTLASATSQCAFCGDPAWGSAALILVAHYRNTVLQQTYVSLSGGMQSGPVPLVAVYAGKSRTAAAINRVTFTNNVGNFDIGTRVSAYGIL